MLNLFIHFYSFSSSLRCRGFFSSWSFFSLGSGVFGWGFLFLFFLLFVGFLVISWSIFGGFFFFLLLLLLWFGLLGSFLWSGLFLWLGGFLNLSSGLTLSSSNIRKRSGGESELIELTHQTSHESVGLFSSNISVLVNIESIPSFFEVSLHVSRNLSSLQFMGSFEDDSSSFRGSGFH
jgi:hypothetical protein